MFLYTDLTIATVLDKEVVRVLSTCLIKTGAEVEAMSSDLAIAR
jgi:hypothetical protein